MVAMVACGLRYVILSTRCFAERRSGVAYEVTTLRCLTRLMVLDDLLWTQDQGSRLIRELL